MKQKGKQTNPNYPNRNQGPRGDASGRGRGQVASSREGSWPAGARGGAHQPPAARLHSPQRCRTGSPQPSSATGPPAAPAASSPPARRLHRLLPPRPPRGRPRSVAARAPRQQRRRQQQHQRRLPGRGLGADTDPRTPRAWLEMSSRRCRAPGLAPFFLSSFRRRDYSSAPPPRRFPRPLPAEQRRPRAPPLPLTTWRLSDTCLSKRGSAAAATAARTRGRGLGRHAPGRRALLLPPSSPQPELLGLAYFQEGRAGEIWGRRRTVGERRGEGQEERKAKSLLLPKVRADRKLLRDVENSGPRLAGEAGEVQCAQSGRCQGPGEGAWGVFSVRLLGGCLWARQVFGTSFNGPAPALSRLTRWAFTCPPLLNAPDDGDT